MEDSARALADTVLTIVQDVSGVFANFPYVGSVATVIQQFITIRNEIKANETRCHQIIDKVLRRSKSICEDLASIAHSDARERLNKLENGLREYESVLGAMYKTLKKHLARRWWEKLMKRGLDELNEMAQRLDDFNLELMLKILVDIKSEQAVLVNKVDKMGTTTPSDGVDHVLPPKPQLMVERESQFNIALEILLHAEPSRIAFLGGGGFGKMTLARSILHESKITEHYQSRYFLSCEGMPDADTLLLGFGTMLGIKGTPSNVLAAARRTLRASTMLICLDNFETPWEPSQNGNRTKVEDVLASIADIPNVSLIITTRGTQRPSKVAWSHPLLPPLSTLSSESARTILQTISPHHAVDEFTEKLLDAVEGIPLAITLIANLIRDGETASALWMRWPKEQTSIIETGGDDRESNLNASIALSVNSPRMQKDPGAATLLAALSLLPDGFLLAEVDRLGESLGVHGVHKLLQTLRAVALLKPEEASSSPRIQMLSPIRLFCAQFLSSEISLVLEKVVTYYIGMLFRTGEILGNSESYSRIVPEIQNMHSVFQRAFKAGYSNDITKLIDGTVELTKWSQYIGYLSQDTIKMALEKSTEYPVWCAKCLLSLGALYRTEGQYTMAGKCFRKAAELAKLGGGAIWQAHALLDLGNLLCDLKQLDEAEDAFKASLHFYTEADDKLQQANAGFRLGELYLSKKRFSDAAASLINALAAYKRMSNFLGQANAAQQLSYLHFSLGNLVDAEKFANESLAMARQAKYAIGEGNALWTLARIYLKADRLTEARQTLEQAVTVAKKQNHRVNYLINVDDLAQVYIQLDMLAAAEALLLGSVDVNSSAEDGVNQVPIILTTLGWLYICSDRLDKAEHHLNTALQQFRKLDDKARQAEVLAHIGNVYFKTNRLDDAERVLKSILELGGRWRNIEVHRLGVLGELYTVNGQYKKAESCLKGAMVSAKWRKSSYEQGNILRSMGVLHVKRCHVDRAIRAFKRALEHHRKVQWVSEQASDLRRLGEAYEILGKSEEAEAALKEAEALMETVREARILPERFSA